MIIMHWCVGLPLVYVLTITLQMGVLGAWMGMTVMFIVQSALMFARFRGGKWKHFKVVVVD